MAQNQSTLARATMGKCSKALNSCMFEGLQAIQYGRSQSQGVERDEGEEDHGAEYDRL